MLEKNSVILGRSGVSYWLNHRQLVSEIELKVSWPTCFMAVCFSGCFRPTTDPHVDSTS